MIGKEEIEHRFGVHKAAIDGPAATAATHAIIRIMFKKLASDLDQNVGDCREKTLAFEALETASMWMHKAIAKDAPLINDNEILNPPKEIAGMDEEGTGMPIEARVTPKNDPRFPH